MNVLIACEFSGVVRDAFLRRGHNAISCDILPSDSPGPHIQGDVLSLLDAEWDLMIAHGVNKAKQHGGNENQDNPA